MPNYRSLIGEEVTIVAIGEILDVLNEKGSLTFNELKKETRNSPEVAGKIDTLIETGAVTLRVNPAHAQKTGLKEHMITWDQINLKDSKKWLEYMYVEEGCSMQDIGEIVGLTREAIRYRMNKMGIEARRKPGDSAQPIEGIGYVYIIGGGGYHKIGRSKHKKKRARTVGSHLPFDVEIKMVIRSNNARQLEQDLHEKFDDKRENGEWFELNEKDLENIELSHNDRIIECNL